MLYLYLFIYTCRLIRSYSTVFDVTKSRITENLQAVERRINTERGSYKSLLSF
jgi:hypothetical protein